MKTVRRPPYPKWNPGYFPCSSLTPLPLSSRRPSVSFGGFGLNLYERAIQALNEAIRLNPQAEAYYNRGVAHRKLGQYELAIEDYDEAIRLNPQYAEAYYLRGAVYGVIGKSIEAERDFGKAKDLGYSP